MHGLVVVSIHAPARGATSGVHQIPVSSMFRSTPLREGRLCAGMDRTFTKEVSIHAPARGATVLRRLQRPFLWVSIHAPARGATSKATRPSRPPCCFDPRPCARGDLIGMADSSVNRVFRSTPLREGRPPSLRTSPLSMRFRSTPLREGRPRPMLPRAISGRFDPRPCARGDLH